MRMRGVVVVMALLGAMAGCSEPGSSGAFQPVGGDGGPTLDAEGDSATGEEDAVDPQQDTVDPQDDVVEQPDEDVVCMPDCTGKECGDDGCGGQCGACPVAAPHCVDNACRLPCEPDCDGKACGHDGCYGTCGECGDGLECVDFACEPECVPDCAGKECGDDGCGGDCGACPAAAPVCQDNMCACVPDCAGKTCGPDGCGGTCGECMGCDGPDDSLCHSGVCYAVCCPSCSGKECGDDGCGGICGSCGSAEICSAGACVGPCDPNPCTNPPPATCSPSGDAVYTHVGIGTCTPAGDAFTCDYAIDVADCGQDACVAGECIPGGDPADYTYETSTWLSSIAFPGEGEECCSDFDGDGEVDNGVGGLIDSLAPLLGADFDANQDLKEAIEAGDLTLLLEYTGLGGLMSDTSMEVNAFLGTWDGTTLSNNLAGQGMFRVQPRSFAPGTDVPLSRFPDASVSNGTLEATGGTFVMPLFGFDLSLVQARIEGMLAGSGDGISLASGRLSGLLPMTQLVAILNGVADSCACLDIDGAAFELAAEDKLGCTAAAKGASPGCTDAAGSICTGLSDNLGIACTAIGILKPDIDTNENGKADHFSVGLYIEGEGASITALGQDAPAGSILFPGCSGGGPAPWLPALLLLLGLVWRRRRISV